MRRMEDLERIRRIAIELTVLVANLEDLIRGLSGPRLSLVSVDQATGVSQDKGSISRDCLPEKTE